MNKYIRTRHGLNHLSSALVICVLLTTQVDAQVIKAQLEEVVTNQGGQYPKTNKSYRFTAAELADTVTVKIINPRGQMQALPVREAKMAALSSLDFGFDTKHWIAGQYHIVVDGRRGKYSKRFKIPDPREKIAATK